MKLNKIIEKLLEKHTVSNLLEEILAVSPWEKLLLTMANKCVYRVGLEKRKKNKQKWYRMARILHRAFDEMGLENKGLFKIARMDVYECKKCKKRFKVDAAKETNCVFSLDKSAMVVTCPGCKLEG